MLIGDDVVQIDCDSAEALRCLLEVLCEDLGRSEMARGFKGLGNIP